MVALRGVVVGGLTMAEPGGRCKFAGAVAGGKVVGK